MKASREKQQKLTRRHQRLRNKIKGTAVCPRLVVVRTAKHISAHIVDDTKGVTLASVTSTAKSFTQYGGNVAAAKIIGQAIGKVAQEKKIAKIVFDRGGHKYHGRVKALADGVREVGIKF